MQWCICYLPSLPAVSRAPHSADNVTRIYCVLGFPRTREIVCPNGAHLLDSGRWWGVGSLNERLPVVMDEWCQDEWAQREWLIRAWIYSDNQESTPLREHVSKTWNKCKVRNKPACDGRVCDRQKKPQAQRPWSQDAWLTWGPLEDAYGPCSQHAPNGEKNEERWEWTGYETGLCSG